jgi:hypothetical protein
MTLPVLPFGNGYHPYVPYGLPSSIMSQGSFSMASTVGHPSPSCDEPITTLTEETHCLTKEMDWFVVMFNCHHANMEKSEQEVQATVWLQAVA